jgi:hypothetical protein
MTDSTLASLTLAQLEAENPEHPFSDLVIYGTPNQSRRLRHLLYDMHSKLNYYRALSAPHGCEN